MNRELNLTTGGTGRIGALPRFTISNGPLVVQLNTKMKTPKQILEALALLAPSVAIETNWTHDEIAQWGEMADCMVGERGEDWQAWNSSVTAKAIVNGKEVCGSAHLGGTWEKHGDDPQQSNPDISGYLPQMIEEALNDLNDLNSERLVEEVSKARNFIRQEMQERYNGQMQPVAA